MEESRQTEDQADAREDPRHGEEPPLPGEGRDPRQRHGHTQAGLRQVELVVMDIHRLVVFGGLLRLGLDLLLFPFVLFRGRFLGGDAGFHLGLRRWLQSGAHVELDPQHLHRVLSDVLLGALALVVGPLVHRSGLGLLHRLDDIAVLHIAQGHEGRHHGHEKRDEPVQAAVARMVLDLLLDRIEGFRHGLLLEGPSLGPCHRQGPSTPDPLDYPSRAYSSGG